MNSEDNFEFRKKFYNLLYEDNQTVETVTALYNMLEQDKDATIIKYNEFGVEYLKRALYLEIKTLIRIIMLRTTREQHKQVMQDVDMISRGFFMECKRENIDRAQYNRGVIMFMREMKVPVSYVIGQFNLLPLENKVINVRHAAGDVDPTDALKHLEITITLGMEEETKDEMQRGHDIASKKKVEKLFKMKCDRGVVPEKAISCAFMFKVD